MRLGKKLAVLCIVTGLLAGGFIGVAGAAEKFPSRPLELVVPTAPGSGASLFTQVVAKAASQTLGKPIDVLHMDGGNGNVAANYVFKQPADGHTLGLYVGSNAGYMNMPGFQTKVTDFTYVMQILRQVHCIYVHKDSPHKTIQDLIAYAKKNPGALDIGTNKVGSIHFYNAEAFAKAAGIKINNIPYKGSGEATKDVMGKHLTAGITGPFTILTKPEYLRILLVLTDKRLPQMPNVPVPSDVGLNYDPPQQIWGLMVKKGVPADRLETIQKAFVKAMDDPEFKKLADEPGNVAEFIDMAKFDPLIHKNHAEYRKALIEMKLIKK